MSTTATDKKYLIAVLAAIGGLLILAVLLALVTVQVMPLLVRNLAAAPRPTRAGAVLAVPGDFAGDFSISTMVAVPLPPGPYSEPSLQYTVYAPLEREQREAGIIRTQKYGYKLSPFVSDASPTRRYRVRYFPPIPDGPHSMSLLRSGSTLRFLIDGRPVYTFPDREASHATRLRLMIGTSIGLSGELASGSFWDLRIHDPLEKYHRPSCSVSWGGVALVPDGSRWLLEGRSNPAELGQRVRHCRSEYS